MLDALPHFNADLEAHARLAAVDSLRSAVSAADAVLIACPEYGFSLPGVIKNAVDWLIGTGELERKRVAITAVVAGPERGRAGLLALRTTLNAVRADVVYDATIPRGSPVQASLADIFAALTADATSGR